MAGFEQRFADWVIRWRWLIIVVSFLCVVAAASGGRLLTFTTNYRVFFSDDNPQLLAFEALENTYSKNDNVLFVLAPKDARAFSQDTLAAIEYLTERAWQTPYSSRVDSISNFQFTESEQDDLVVRDLVSESRRLSDDERSLIEAIALSEPIVYRRLISQDSAVAGVNVTVYLPGEDETKETPEVVEFSRALAAEIREKFPNIDVYITGMVIMNNAFSESSQNDSFAVMAIMLWLLTRGFVGTVATLVVVGLSVMFAMGAGGWVGFPLSPPSVSAPTIILTVAIANCVHVLVTYLQRLRVGDEKQTALKESLRVNLQPVFLASLTTTLGFLSMNFSDVPPFRHLGTFVAFGVFASFFLSVMFLPAVLSVMPGSARVTRDGEDVLMTRVGEFVVRRHRLLLWSMLGIAVVLIASVPRNELNDVFVKYFDETVEFRAHADYTVEHLTGLYQVEYSLDSGQSGGVSDPEFLRQASAYVDWLRAQPEVVHVMSVTDIFKRLNKNMHADEQSYFRLPDNRELSAQYLLLYEMSLPYGLDLNNQLNVDKSATRITVTTQTLSSNDVLAFNRRAEQWLAANAQSITSNGTGTTIMFANIGKRNIKSMLLGTTVALIGISLVLVVALRSVKIGLVSLVPNLIPGAMAFGVWGLFVGEVGLSLSVVTSMTLGIVVDDTVHFLSKYRRARSELGLDAAKSVVYAFRTVGRALVITSLVLAAGFLVLSQSTFELNAGMGLLTALVIVLALTADFLLLPPLLMKIEGDSDEADDRRAISEHSTA